MNGIWGTVSIGLFGAPALLGVKESSEAGLFYGGNGSLLGVQALGALAVSAFVVLSMGLVFLTIKKTIGLRVGRSEELRGLDIGEHGMESYAGFQVFTTQ